ncbi:hypothetical protein SAMN05444008_102417 [Cnuella takakiae]|uniref:Uncharacterized protein n=1 Tax=Cnuella takakiae TaxID=1302690 RepID=A0A1M4VXK9_9BACT|nr:hypothetical protein [Cnuella takakiae]OLY92469.1 hypothetical protein BUE76_11665 [Cnuella takakiae]SHE73687.1 hypothetical protein SAMN05444008_102417 [Cnuella takakiae]
MRPQTNLNQNLDALESLEKRIIAGVLTLVVTGYFVGADLIKTDLRSRTGAKNARSIRGQRTGRRDVSYPTY